MKIYLIRHLPTEWNKKGKLQGSRDIPIDLTLVKNYQAEIQKNQQVLTKVKPFQHVLASSLVRTQQTAKIYGYIAETDSLLDELDFGIYEGRPKSSLLGDYIHDWYYNPEAICLGESLVSFKKRIVAFIDKYKTVDNLLVFGHGSWIRALLSIHKTNSLREMNQITIKNNQLITIELNINKRC